MSETVYDDAGLIVTQLVGPAGPDDRRLWQFVAPDGYATLTLAQVYELLATLMAATVRRR